MSIVVYGASDDLVEVDGDIVEEFNPEDGPSYLAFEDGTVLRVSYDGLWHITRIAEGSATFEKLEAFRSDGNRVDGKPAYSDVATLTGLGGLPIAWCVFGSRYEAPRSSR